MNAPSADGRSERDGHPQVRAVVNVSSLTNWCKPAHEKWFAQLEPSLLHEQADTSLAHTITSLVEPRFLLF